MSMSVDSPLGGYNTRPTPQGRRRTPRTRDADTRRPSQIYRAAIEISIGRMVVIDHLRRGGFRTS